MKLKQRILILSAILLPLLSNAQCAMCRAVLENSGDSSKAEGINQGIMYLMVFPYVLIGGLGVFIWWHLKKHKKTES